MAWHAVFSTQDRLQLITPEIRADLFAYLGGIVKGLKGTPLIINGIEDHVHMLVKLPPVISFSEAMQVVKSSSTGWVHEKWPHCQGFSWQRGFAAFSVSASAVSRVRQYILNQQVHHRRISFRDELIVLLRKHNIPFDERFLL